MKCQACQNEIADSIDKCNVCGAQQTPVSTQPTAPNPVAQPDQATDIISTPQIASMAAEAVNIQPTITEPDKPNEPVAVNTGAKKPRKKHKARKVLLLILLLIILSIIFIPKAIDSYNLHVLNEKLLKLVKVQKDADIKLTKDDLAKDTDGDGIINSKEIELGLNLIEQDSDGDGLNDNDEINIYQSDPKKYSTSGDIFGDGYKIQNNIDINSVHKGNFEIKTENKDVTLSVKSAKDMEAVYKVYAGNVPSDYILAESIKPFRIYSFSGTAKINIEEPNNYEVISYDNINKITTKAKYERGTSSISIDIRNDNPLLVVYTKSAIKKVFGNNFIATSDTGGGNNVDSEYIVIAFPLLSVLSDTPIYIFESDNTGLKTENKTLVSEINAKIDTASKEYAKENDTKSSYMPTIKHTYIHSFAIKMLDLIFNKILSQTTNEADPAAKSTFDLLFIYRHLHGKESLFNFFFGYGSKEDKQETTPADVYDEKYKNTDSEIFADSGFSESVNAFRFENLSTEESDGGVCAGFAGITTQIFNDSPISRSGVSENPFYVTKSYDLTSNNYDNIFNKLLYSYEPTSEGLKSYADENRGDIKLDSSKMPTFDNEIVKAINFHYEKENFGRLVYQFKGTIDHKNQIKVPISGDTIEKVINKFKSGKIVTLSVMGGPGNHAINAYKIAQDKNDPDILYLKVYDNNFPNDMYWANIGDDKDNSRKKYDFTITLKRFYKKSILGSDKDYYYFDYSPFGKNMTYSWGNIDELDVDNLSFFDENNNVIK